MKQNINLHIAYSKTFNKLFVLDNKENYFSFNSAFNILPIYSMKIKIFYK